MFGVIKKVVGWPLRVFGSTPELEKPVANPRYLPENTKNWLASTWAMWYWGLKNIEYGYVPGRRGVKAWVRLLLAIAFPVIIITTLVGLLAFLVSRMSGLTVEVVKLVVWFSVLCLVVAVFAGLIYGVYALVMILRGRPFKLPEIKPLRSGEKDAMDKNDESEDDIIDVGED